MPRKGRRGLQAMAVGAGAVLLSGCITTALYVANRPSQAVLNEMERWCRKDSGVRWFGDPPRDLDLWMVGELDRDPGAGADLSGLRPLAGYWVSDASWIRLGMARRVYINIDRPLGPGSMFSPPAESPGGVYELTLAARGDPSFAPYEAHRAQLDRWDPPERRRKWDQCLVIRYVGPFDGRPRPNMVVHFEDATAKARGFRRWGRALIVDGKVRATEAHYSAVSPNGSSEHAGHWGVKACAGPWRGITDEPA